MMNRSKLISLAKGLLGSRRISYDKRVIHPTRDWLFGLLLFFVVVVMGGGYSAYQFVIYRNVSVNVDPLNESTVKYNQALVQSVLTQYSLYKENYDALHSRAPAVEASASEEAATTTEEARGEEEPEEGDAVVPVLE